MPGAMPGFFPGGDMKVWVEIVAIDGRRIKNPIREDYEDRRDDDPICTACAADSTAWLK